MKKTQINFDENQQSTLDINQLTCSLKNSIFSMYISDYLIEKIDEFWNLYEKRIDQYLQTKHIDIYCHHQHSPMTIYLDKLIKQEQEHIATCRREIRILCTSHDIEKSSVSFQSTQKCSTSENSIQVPRIPRCIDRYDDNIIEE